MSKNQLTGVFLVAFVLVLITFSTGRASSLFSGTGPYGAAVVEPTSKELSTSATYNQVLPPGTTGQTLRNQNGRWLATSNLFNTGTNVGIGNVGTPSERLVVDGNINLLRTTPGTGGIMINGSPLLSGIGSSNVFFGFDAGNQGVTGPDNVGLGTRALANVTSGGRNVGVGTISLYRNTTGSTNTAVGFQTLNENLTGSSNVAIGYGGLHFNDVGNQNVAMGVSSLGDNTSGSGNTALGHNALPANITSDYSTAVGYFALMNSLGAENTALGYNAGSANVNGTHSTFIGSRAGESSSSGLVNATAIGYNAQVSQNNSLVLGGVDEDAVKVGIGTKTPSAELDVIGEVKISGISNDGAGKLLCVKPGGTIGTCSTAPDAGGSCSCN